MGITFMYLQYIAPLFITLCKMFGRRRTLSAHPSLLMFRIDRPIARVSSSLELYRAFHFVEDIAIEWTHIWRVQWMFQNLPSPAAQEVRDSRRCNSWHCDEE